MIYFNTKKGFTLTEIMIAMAVIGIISALVVPAVIRKYSKSGFENQLGSFYNDLNQAMSIAQAESSDNLSRTPLATGNTGGILKNYMQLKHNCGENRTPCFATSYTAIDSDETANSADFCTTGKSFLLTSGAAVCITPMSIDADNTLDNVADIFVDINGEEKPNMGGKDMFRMNLYADATIDEQVTPSTRAVADRVDLGATCTTSPTGEGCFTQYMRDKMKITYYD